MKWYEKEVPLFDENDSRSWCERELERLKELRKHRDLTDEEFDSFWYCETTLAQIESERRYLNGEDY